MTRRVDDEGNLLLPDDEIESYEDYYARERMKEEKSQVRPLCRTPISRHLRTCEKAMKIVRELQDDPDARDILAIAVGIIKEAEETHGANRLS